MVVLMVALCCRKEEVRRLGCAGGVLFIAYFVFQLVAVLLIVAMRTIFNARRECLTLVFS